MNSFEDIYALLKCLWIQFYSISFHKTTCLRLLGSQARSDILLIKLMDTRFQMID